MSIRNSKVRHVFSEASHPDLTFTDIRYTSTGNDRSAISCNGKFFSIPTRGGGGPVFVIPLSKPGRQSHPAICGHTSVVLCTDWNPFDDCMVATGSEDCTIKCWSIPEGGAEEMITTPVHNLVGHGKSVFILSWNPVASNILASASKDQSIRIWDVEKDECKFVYETGKNIHSMEWNEDGSLIGISFTDNTFQLYDPRANSVLAVSPT